MGSTTDFLGHFTIDPPLNTAEQHYLMAFSDSRRYNRPGGPYDVPYNPAAENAELNVDVDTYNAIAPGQPSLWCHWTPNWGGASLAHSGREKSYGATEWLAYLIAHFLAPAARAAESTLPCFAQFTFDHVLNGIIAANQRDTRRLYLIRIVDNVITEHTLVPGDPQWPDALLDYEVWLDESQPERRPARRARSR